MDNKTEQKLIYYVINNNKISKKTISQEALNKLNNSKNKANFIIGYDNYAGCLPVLQLTNKNTIGKLTVAQQKLVDYCNFSLLHNNPTLTDLYDIKTKNMFRLTNIVYELKNYFKFDQCNLDKLNRTFKGSIRYWGEWVNPEFAENEEDYDLQDYDWKVLTDKSYKKLKNIIDGLNKKYKKANITFRCSEKCWIDIEVSESQK